MKELMMTTSEYVVTKKAGPKVAGRRVSEGDRLSLTEDEALAELLAGVILPLITGETEAGREAASSDLDAVDPDAPTGTEAAQPAAEEPVKARSKKA
jgi:hypothetical protein